MSTEDKLQGIFESLVSVGQGHSMVRDLYEMQPFMTPRQQRMFLVVDFLAHKYESPVLGGLAVEYKALQQANRPVALPFWRGLSHVSLYEYFQKMNEAPRDPRPAGGGHR